MSILSAFEEVRSIENALKTEIERHKKIRGELKLKLVKAKQTSSIAVAGLDLEKIELAKSVISVTMKSSASEHRKKIINSAINDIIDGCKHLSEKYFCVKIYSGFGEQIENHQYGYGPRHGSIVFSIELKDRKKQLSTDEVEACLYFLANHSKIVESMEIAA